MYDKAWRMALSYRWRKGQLVVVDELDVPRDRKKEAREYWLKWVLDGLGWGRNGEGHSFYISENRKGAFEEALEACDRYGRYRPSDEVDVKNLLEMKRLVVERGALMKMLRHHQSDLRLPLIRSPEEVARRAAIMQASEAELSRVLAETQAQAHLDAELAEEEEIVEEALSKETQDALFKEAQSKSEGVQYILKEMEKEEAEAKSRS